jgi:hypothetical protein
LRGKYDDRIDEGILLEYATNSKGYICFNKILYNLVDCIDLKVDEGFPVREVSNIESAIEDTAEAEDEQVQELKEKTLSYIQIHCRTQIRESILSGGVCVV